MKNTLYYGDNLDVMRRYVKDDSVDLVYLDPPFNSNADYNVLFEEHSGDRAAAQIKAFEDTWTWNTESALAYEETVENGGLISLTLQAFRAMLGDSDMLAYLAMMAPRLVELHRVLKPTGSLYLHCDSTASHYLKLLLDSIFGKEAFVNEIIWKRYGAHNDVGQGSRHFGRTHDTLLFYSKSKARKWNQLFVPLDAEYVESTYRWEDEHGRFMTTPLTGPGGAEKGNPVYEWNGHVRAWRYSKDTMQGLHDEGRLYYSKTGYVRQKFYLQESRGVPVQDVWIDISSLSGAHAERLGYPTQKPEALLDRVLSASTNPGDVVLDPFCGCGTTIAVAQRLGRAWLGIDITHLAIGLIRHRLQQQFGASIGDTYSVIGEPVSLPDAQKLAGEDAYQFQFWALGLIGARPAQTQQKRGADRGIDGNVYFHDDPRGKTKRIIISVKAGANINVSMVRDLVGTITREGAEIGVLLTMTEPTGPMVKEAAGAGFYTSPMGGKHAKIQILTVADLLGGKGVDYPARSQRIDKTFKKAPVGRPPDIAALKLGLAEDDGD